MDELKKLIEKTIQNSKVHQGPLKNQDFLFLEEMLPKIAHDKNYFLEIPADFIVDALHDMGIEASLNEMLQQYLFIQDLLEGNQKENLGFVLEEEQVLFLEKIYQILKTYQAKLQTEYEEQEQDREENRKQIEIYQEILDKLNLKKENNYIQELDILEQIWHKNQISEKEKTPYLLSLLKHNKQVFEQRQTKQEKYVPKTVIKDKEDIQVLFQKYGYDVYKVKPLYQELLSKKDRNEMEDVLKIIKRKSLLIKETDQIFPALLLYSNPSIIHSILSICKNKLLDISLVKRNPSIFISKETIPFIDDIVIDSRKQFGAYENFKASIKFLEQINVPLADLYKISGIPFILPTYLLQNNYELMQLYRLDLSYQTNAAGLKRFCQALSSPKLADMIDQYIEQDAYDYICHHPSRLKDISNKQPFYRMYYLRHQTPPQNYDYGMHSMIAEIHQREPAFQITNENGKERVGAITPVIHRQATYDYILNSSYNNTISYQTLHHPYIQELDKEIKWDASQKQMSYRRNKMVYQMGTCLISRLKVLRYFETLLQSGETNIDEILLHSITKNTILNEEEFMYIKEVVEKIKKTVHYENEDNIEKKVR